MQNSFKFYSDPSHGWLKVPMSLIIELGIADEISNYSYIHKGDVFLEEDSDMTLFHDAYLKTNGKPPSIVDQRPSHSPSRIRDYESYEATMSVLLLQMSARLSGLMDMLRD